MKQHSSPVHRRSIAVPIIAGAALLYLITTNTLVSYLAPFAPGAALMLKPSSPQALMQLADSAAREVLGADAATDEGSTSAPKTKTGEDERLKGFARLPGNEAAQPREPEIPAEPRTNDTALKVSDAPEVTAAAASIRDWTERALTAHPVSAHALSLLGMMYARSGGDEKATSLLAAATHRSARVPIAEYWMLRKAFEAKDYAQAMTHADAILRYKPEYIAAVAPFLGRIAEAEGASQGFGALLGSNPAWRPAFFRTLEGNIKDARTPLSYLLMLKETPYPPSRSELAPYIGLLINAQYWELAYNAWLQFLPPEQLSKAGFVFNGGFDFVPAPFPFDWQMTPGTGVVMDLAHESGSSPNSILAITFGPGRVQFHPVRQTTLLAPGDYTLTARTRGEIRARRGLKWTVSCATNPPVKLGESPEINGLSRDWERITLSFSVPKDSCRAQVVALVLDARSASETMVSGVLQFDDIAISRAEQNSSPKLQ